MSAPLAVYERRIRASLERVWENVRDWEHLPYLHASAFCGIACEEAGPWGWRARVALPPREAPREIVVEVRAEPDGASYHTRTLAGPGSGADVWTQLSAVDASSTDIRVEFHVPGVAGESAERLGRGYVALYTRLWDEDEAMMQRRQALLDGVAARPPRADLRGACALGPLEALRAGLPRRVNVGGHRFRVVEAPDGRLLAHSVVCPHLGGPLDDARIEGGAVVCPWHGYHFDTASGRGPGAQRCRLPVTARVEVDAAGTATLVVGPPP
jgi:nitrite reductase/ring-hydroxylating ferredoxin subunit